MSVTARTKSASQKWTTRKKRTLLEKLERLYPEPASELNFKSNYQLLVAVVLSAQCTDKKVNQVTPDLFRRYANFKQLGLAEQEELEVLIRSVNYYRTKARNLIATGKELTATYRGRIPHTMEELIRLPGVGRKTANVVLSELGITPSFPVDTHVYRVSHRLGLAEGKTPEEVEDQLCEQFPPEQWRPLHHWLIFHGRRVCKARSPQCGECSLKSLCPSAELKS